MSLESILNNIINEANSQKEKIIQEARQQANIIIQAAKQEAEKLYQELIDREKNLSLAGKQKLIVNARLESKKKLLSAKQELIKAVFEKLRAEIKKDKLKKKQVLQDKTLDVLEDIDFYLNKIRFDYESEIAKILFS